MTFSTDWSEAGFLRIGAKGRLSASDYDQLEPAVADELAKRGGRAPLLLDLRGWSGWTPGGLARDLRFDIRHRNSFSRIAVVGNRRWHEWLTLAAKPVFAAPMRYFGLGQESHAMEWLGGN